jgi:membrane protease YdiL (CAAX protease family)
MVTGVSIADTSKVVVGSRAEAKAVRKAAAQAAKTRSKSVAYAGKPVAAARRGAAAAGAAAASGVAAVAAHDGENGAAPVGRETSPDATSGNGPTAKPTSSWRSRLSAGSKDFRFVPGSSVWGAKDLVVVLGTLLVTVLAKDYVLGIHAVGLMPAAGRTIVRAAVLAVYYSLQLAVFAWLAARHRLTLWNAFGLGRRRVAADKGSKTGTAAPSAIGSLGLVAVLFAGTELFAITYGLAMQTLGLTQPARLSSDLSEVFGSGGVGLALSVLLVALVAPFAEELAFRGVVMPVLGSRWGMWPAIVGSSVIFAAYHFSAWLFAPTFVLGIALGWLGWTRRSLWPPILLHVLYNAAAVGAGFFVAR